MNLRLRLAAGIIRIMTLIAVNFRDNFVVTEDGRRLPITNLFDEDNMPTAYWQDAASFVAGAGGEWYAGRTSDWIEVTIH